MCLPRVIELIDRRRFLSKGFVIVVYVIGNGEAFEVPSISGRPTSRRYGRMGEVCLTDQCLANIALELRWIEDSIGKETNHMKPTEGVICRVGVPRKEFYGPNLGRI